VWHVAWRKALLPTADCVESNLQKTNEQQWKDHTVAALTLREHQIEHKVELKGHFRDDGIEPNLFLEINLL
jgi:hypothetical protein